MARRSTRKTRRSTRRNRTSKRGLFRTLYTPVEQTIGAADNITRATTRTAEGIVHATLMGLNTIGRRVTDRANTVVRKMLTRRRKH
jgi:hypothetical protein